jgi:hypothetical protein
VRGLQLRIVDVAVAVSDEKALPSGCSTETSSAEMRPLRSVSKSLTVMRQPPNSARWPQRTITGPALVEIDVEWHSRPASCGTTTTAFSCASAGSAASAATRAREGIDVLMGVLRVQGPEPDFASGGGNPR